MHFLCLSILGSFDGPAKHQHVLHLLLDSPAITLFVLRYTCAFMNSCVCACAWLCVRRGISLFLCGYTCVYTYLCVCVCVCVCVSVCVCVCVCVSVCVCGCVC